MTFLTIVEYFTKLDTKTKKKFRATEHEDKRHKKFFIFTLEYFCFYLFLVSLRRSRRLLFSRAFRKKVSRHAKSRKVQSKPVLGGLRGRKRRR